MREITGWMDECVCAVCTPLVNAIIIAFKSRAKSLSRFFLLASFVSTFMAVQLHSSILRLSIMNFHWSPMHVLGMSPTKYIIIGCRGLRRAPVPNTPTSTQISCSYLLCSCHASFLTNTCSCSLILLICLMLHISETYICHLLKTKCVDGRACG